MDKDISRLLQEWGLSQYSPVFEGNNISLATLSMLDNYLVKELIGPVGDRAKFLKNLENWKKITLTEADIFTSTSNDEFVDMLNPSHKKILTVSEFITPLNTQIDDNKDCEELSILANNTDNNTENDWTIITDVELEVDDANTLPLKSLLMKSNEGQTLLNLYMEEGKLSSNGRRKLCNIIIKDLIEKDPTKRIDSTLLLEKAQEIKDVFKKENISTYFIPYINDSKLKIKRCAKGKLYDCLQNRRRELREAKIIKTNKSTNSNTNNELQESAETENCNDEIQWLQNCTEPWHTVVEKWQRTARHRLNDLSSSNKSIDSYIKKFPILNTPRGHELLTADFKYMFPSSDNKLYENFPIIKQKLFKLALAKCQLTEVKEILEQCQLLKKDDENYEEIETILAFMLLPLLLGNPTHKGKKQVWRPSKAEVKDGFITHVQRPIDLQYTIAKRREKYLKYNLTFQPTIVIAGPNYSNIQKYYVVVNDLFFETHSILQTVDTCFKIYHSLYCQYPAESMCVWNFVQIGLYRLKTKWDKDYSTVNAFITDLDLN